MSISLQVSPSSYELLDVSTPLQFVREWKIGEKAVRLFRETDSLTLLSEGETLSSYTFRPRKYDILYALNLVHIFWHIIGENLQRESLHSSCFLPSLSLQAENAPEIEVALFGRLDASTNPAGELKGVRWGIFNTRTHTQQSLEVSRDDLSTLTSIRNALSRDDSFPFSVTLERDESGRVHQLFLHHLSLLDRKTRLTEREWAVTLVSSKNSSSESCVSRLFVGRVGHALLACEGLRDGTPFLTYIHLTQDPRDKLPNLDRSHAQIESFSRTAPLDTANGPTWKRPREAVENMLRFVERQRGKAIKFALYSPHFPGLRALKMVISNEFLSGQSSASELSGTAPDSPQHIQPKEDPLNCLDFAVLASEYAGIIFYGHVTGTTPLRKIEMLGSAPQYQLPEGIQQLLRSKLYPDRQDVVRGMLSACVILTPKDCRPEHLRIWRVKAYTEEIDAVERELAGLRRIDRSEVWGGYVPKRWK